MSTVVDLGNLWVNIKSAAIHDEFFRNSKEENANRSSAIHCCAKKLFFNHLEKALCDQSEMFILLGNIKFTQREFIECFSQ